MKMSTVYSDEKHFAFTLAEVLITLLIIGVVASIVVPALINDTNEAEYNVGLKKAQAELSNALKMIQVNNGGVVNVGSSDHTGLRNEFCNIMTCVRLDAAKNIFGPANYKFYKGSSTGFPGNESTPSATLNNGYLLKFFSYPNCNAYGVHACGYIDLDINGTKGPNMAGKDFYNFYIARQNVNGTYLVIPRGTQGDTFATLPNGCTEGSSTWETSEGCTAQRLYHPENMP